MFSTIKVPHCNEQRGAKRSSCCKSQSGVGEQNDHVDQCRQVAVRGDCLRARTRENGHDVMTDKFKAEQNHKDAPRAVCPGPERAERMDGGASCETTRSNRLMMPTTSQMFPLIP